MIKRIATTDDRYVKVDEGEWWDTTGIGTVPAAIVDEYMRTCRVGIIETEIDENDEFEWLH